MRTRVRLASLTTTVVLTFAAEAAAQVVVGPLGGAFSNGLGIGVVGEAYVNDNVSVASTVVYVSPSNLRYYWEVNADLLLGLPLAGDARVQPFFQVGVNYARWAGRLASHGFAPNVGAGVRIRAGSIRLVMAAKAEIREGGPGAVTLGLGLPVRG